VRRVANCYTPFTFIVRRDVSFVVVNANLRLECRPPLYRVAQTKADYLLLFSVFYISTTKNESMIMYVQHQEH